MGPEWAERPLTVQVALDEANPGRSHLPVVVPAELEGWVTVPAQVVAAVPAQVVAVA